MLTRGISDLGATWGEVVGVAAGEGCTLPSRDITTVLAGDTGIEPSPNSSSEAREREVGG